MSVDLTHEQLRAIQGARDTLKSEGLFKIGGYAGTGKTTIAKEIVKAFNHVAVCAFMGKACQQLRLKGLKQAQTMHRLMYRWDQSCRHFVKKSDIECDLVVLDEGSTVNGKLWNDLLSYGRPVCVIGDPGQLPPVGKDPNLMENCDIVLEHIHRYSGQLAKDADYIRKHGEFPKHVPIHRLNVDSLKYFNDCQWICGFNKTRHWANEVLLKHNKQLVMIVLRNNYKAGVFNGMFMTPDPHIVGGWLDELGEPYYFPWSQQEPDLYDRDTVWMVPGYCVTCHKMQGSETEKVAYIDEHCELWEPVRHRYTGWTRAKGEVHVFSD